MRPVSDDDLCATCQFCLYEPGDRSTCQQGWPGLLNADGYCLECPQYQRKENAEE